MRKVLVIGPGGAGKSTFARRLGALLQIEVIHLDSLYWRPGWVEPAKEEWKEILADVIKREAWIMDGNYSGTLAMRYEACDTVIFLDIAPATCVWRVIKRSVMYRTSQRPDMATGCPERLTLEFLAWIWNYRRRTRPKVLRLLSENRPGKTVIHLRSAAEVERFLKATKDAARDSATT